MNSNRILKITLLSLVFIVGLMFINQQKAAAASWCAVLAYAPSGNCLDGQDYNALTNLSSSDSSDTLKAKLLSKMNGFESGQHFQRVGAKWTEDQFTGGNASQFNSYINQDDVTLEVGIHAFTKNSAYDPAADADFYYADTDSKMSVKIRQDGVFIGAIKLDCGNIIGDITTTIKLNRWTLTGDTDRDITSADTGQVVHFDHTIRNNGPSKASYNWWVRGSYNNSPFSVNTGYTPPLPSGSRSGTASGATGPTNYAENYIFPASAVRGDKYCQRIDYSNAAGPGTPEDHSLKKCVVYNPGGGPPPTSGSDECFTATIPRPPQFGAGNTARTRYWVDGSNATGGSIQSDSSSPSVTINYLPDSPDGAKATVTVHMVTEYNNTNPAVWKAEFATSGGNAMAGYTAPVTRSHDCYAATCNLSVEGGTGPNGMIMAGQAVTIKGEIVNAASATYPEKSDLPSSMPGGAQLGLTTGGGVQHPIGVGVELNDSKPDPLITLGTVTALSSPGTQTISGYAYPDYYTKGGIGPVCPDISFNVYQYFNIDPTASTPVGDSEQPSAITYRTSGTKTQGPDITATATSWLTNGLSIVDPKHSASHVYGTAFDDSTFNVTSISPGDNYCSHVIISPASGYAGPGGPLYRQDAQDDSGCLTIHNEPYVHFTGSDVFAGFGFGKGATCAPSAADSMLRAYTKTTGVLPRGSGAQYAALSIGQIEGFSSAYLRNLVPTASSGLSFASSTATPTPSGNKPVTGGTYGVSEKCTMPDYYNVDKPDGASPYAGEDLGQSGTHAYTKTGSINIPAINVVDGANNAVYVDGDVNITDNIIYSGHAAWNDVNKIPSLLIVAKGNITISKDVTQLDGIFVAQPTDTNTKGIIDTCSPKGLIACQKQLVINGTFLAKQVFLNRTYSSLRFSQQNESKLYGASHPCGAGPLDAPSTHQSDQDCAAEVFNFSPEIYMSQPAMNPNNRGNYQSFKSLAPIL